MRSSVTSKKNIRSNFCFLNWQNIRLVITSDAQSTIAGKFPEYCTSYPWIHLDTAGTFLDEKDHHNCAGGTGFGTRLLYNFL
ncbi:MAG TPA: hypothetical protein DER09_02970, partial [Prolixibacteraceae bacterium]|nr:hypothetical protein [Prolixibacteraceae bacterium]